MIFVGIDAGGTSSRLKVVSDDGFVLEAQSGPANWATTQRDVLADNLCQLLAPVLHADAIFVGMAGVLTSSDQEGAANLIKGLGDFNKVVVNADFVPAWRACDCAEAVLTISGTGSNVTTRVDGKIHRLGMGGSLIADHGSGFGVGRALLTAWLNSDLRSLDHLVKDFTGSEDCNEAVAWFYRSASPASKIAEFGSYCCSNAPDITAFTLRQEMEILATYARTLGNSHRNAKFFRAGGFWNASPRVVGYFEEALQEVTHEPPMSPLDGAVLLAQELITV